MLLENDADPDATARGSHGMKMNALHIAASENRTAVIRLLLHKGLAINGADEEGQTALHIAARRGHREATRLLVELGANTAVADNNRHTPLQLVLPRTQRACYQDVAAVLLEHEGEPQVEAHFNGLLSKQAVAEASWLCGR